MKLIVISPSVSLQNEHQLVNSLFEEGLDIFHIHKPDFSEQEIKNFISRIPEKNHGKIFFHTDFPKFHSLPVVLPPGTTMYFLSPVFDSISKQGYKSKFNLQELKIFLQKQKILSDENSRSEAIALGGIDEDKIQLCSALGFAGVAVCGAIWQNNNPLEKFKKLKTLCQKKDLVF